MNDEEKDKKYGNLYNELNKTREKYIKELGDITDEKNLIQNQLNSLKELLNNSEESNKISYDNLKKEYDVIIKNNQLTME